VKKLSVKLEHCYGIKNLSAEFDFSKRSAYAIYAPNGVMKSSFAKTFSDLANGQAPSDKIFPDRASSATIVDDTGADLDAGQILVVLPYDEVLGHSEKTSTLLVNAELRKEYEALYADINASKDAFLAAMKEASKSKRDLAAEISATFTKRDDEFFKAIVRVSDEVKEEKESPFAKIAYDLVFDEKAAEFLSTKDFKSVIDGYIKKYNELLAASTYFKKGVFNYHNASTIAKSLADNGFFKAKHTLRLNADAAQDISNEKDLEKLIADEKKAITDDADLRKKFSEIDKLLNKNAGMRQYYEYLCDNEFLLPELANMAELQEKVWKSYFVENRALFEDLVAKYQATEKRRREIEEAASKERTQWEDVIDIFNSRFFVPFKLEAINRTSVILGQEPMLTLGFTFFDEGGEAQVERADLLQVLSTGEKKALYVLNVIFEIEARRAAKEETILIVDDIADSFDYKNKFAIIQYLRDISESGNCKLIILTHNFDFFRTLCSRFVGYGNCLYVLKDAKGMTLEPAVGIKNVFVNDWKPNFSADIKKRIASIPFMRNLVEYTRGESDADYLRLTALLHWMGATDQVTDTELFEIYNRLFTPALPLPAAATRAVDQIYAEAESCLKAADGINFENKIVLSIASRLKAEHFMVQKINDAAVTDAITSNQTGALVKEFRARFPAETASLAVLDRVALMTPENIHLNSFMYEPIMDMSDAHLRKLYEDAKALA